VALVSLAVLATVAVMRATIAYTDARCPGCRRRVMAVPGVGVTLEVRMVRTDAERSGRGRVVGCARCKGLVEVIEHR
jgi:DNA-directed RNA polymerase subunit RPC12/RpoP